MVKSNSKRKLGNNNEIDDLFSCKEIKRYFYLWEEWDLSYDWFFVINTINRIDVGPTFPFSLNQYKYDP